MLGRQNLINIYYWVVLDLFLLWVHQCVNMCLWGRGKHSPWGSFWEEYYI